MLVGAALFAFTRLATGPATLSTLQQVSIPYEDALTNGKPTLLEFYADWCEICRATAPDVYQVHSLPFMCSCDCVVVACHKSLVLNGAGLQSAEHKLTGEVLYRWSSSRLTS